MIASEGPPVDAEVANAAPILSVGAPDPGPHLTYNPVPGLPPELQPSPGDILLSRAFWPWTDLGAQGIPEDWLYMSRHVQGTIAMLTVQTPSGPKLVSAQSDGSLNIGSILSQKSALFIKTDGALARSGIQGVGVRMAASTPRLANFHVVLHNVVARIRMNAAGVATVAQFQVWRDIYDTGSLQAKYELSVDGTLGSSDRLIIPNLDLHCGANDGAGFAFDAAYPNVVESFTVTYYYESDDII